MALSLWQEDYEDRVTRFDRSRWRSPFQCAPNQESVVKNCIRNQEFEAGSRAISSERYPTQELQLEHPKDRFHGQFIDIERNKLKQAFVSGPRPHHHPPKTKMSKDFHNLMCGLSFLFRLAFLCGLLDLLLVFIDQVKSSLCFGSHLIHHFDNLDEF